MITSHSVSKPDDSTVTQDGSLQGALDHFAQLKMKIIPEPILAPAPRPMALDLTRCDSGASSLLSSGPPTVRLSSSLSSPVSLATAGVPSEIDPLMMLSFPLGSIAMPEPGPLLRSASLQTLTLPIPDALAPLASESSSLFKVVERERDPLLAKVKTSKIFSLTKKAVATGNFDSPTMAAELAKYGNVHHGDGDYYFEETKEARDCGRYFLDKFWQESANCQLMMRKQVEKHNIINRHNAEKNPVSPSCISFVPAIFRGKQYCFVACSQPLSMNYRDVIQALQTAAENLNKSSHFSHQFIVLSECNHEFNGQLRKLLNELKASPAEHPNRFCAEKYFMRLITQVIYYFPAYQQREEKAHRDYGRYTKDQNKITGAANMYFFPYLKNTVYGKRAKLQPGEKNGARLAVNPLTRHGNRIVSVGKNYCSSFIPCCSNCKANAPAAKMIPAVMEQLNHAQAEEIKRTGNLSTPLAYKELSKDRRSQRGLISHPPTPIHALLTTPPLSAASSPCPSRTSSVTVMPVNLSKSLSASSSSGLQKAPSLPKVVEESSEESVTQAQPTKSAAPLSYADKAKAPASNVVAAPKVVIYAAHKMQLPKATDDKNKVEVKPSVEPVPQQKLPGAVSYAAAAKKLFSDVAVIPKSVTNTGIFKPASAQQVLPVAKISYAAAAKKTAC